jgi:hypothetical protein
MPEPDPGDGDSCGGDAPSGQGEELPPPKSSPDDSGKKDKHDGDDDDQGEDDDDDDGGGGGGGGGAPFDPFAPEEKALLRAAYARDLERIDALDPAIMVRV